MKRLLTNFKIVIKLVCTQKTISFIKFLKGIHLFMQIMDNSSAFSISHADTLRFRKIVLDVLSERCKIADDDEDVYGGIGTLGEKQMHAAIKRFICPDESCHEIKIDGSALCIDRETDGKDNTGDGKSANKKKRRFVADVLVGNTIYEIQTGPFSPLKEKIQWILDNTSYNIVVIHPIAETKWLNYINDENGEVERRKKSPQKGKFTDIAGELYYLRDFIGNPRFSLVLLMMEAEQYKKKSAEKSRRRSPYRKYELIPVSLLRAHVFKATDDYRAFIPDGLSSPFCVKDYSSFSGIKGRDAYSIVKTLTYLGFFEESGKIGRATAYTVK